MTMDEASVNWSEKRTAVDHLFSLTEVREKLDNEAPGVLVLDVDYTIKKHTLDPRKFGMIPSESMEILKALKGKGWEVGFATNQPEKGHQVAEGLGKIYPEKDYFPYAIIKEFGEGRIFGGGWDYLWNRFKKKDSSPEKVRNWVKEKLREVEGKVYFVGDLPTDVDFFDKVSLEIPRDRIGKIFKLPSSPVKI